MNIAVPTVAILIITLGALLVLDRNFQRRHRERIPSTPDPCTNQRHPIVITGAQEVPGAQFPTTAVLARCLKCGAHFSAHHFGHWTLEDFAKTDNTAAAEVSLLKRMVG